MNLSIQEILNVTKGTLLFGEPEAVLSGVSIDSRELNPGTLFVPIRGEKTDGHNYLKAAAKEADAVLSASREAAEDALAARHAAVILVEDTVAALQEIGKAARKKELIPAVGVTGSVGKTTTRELITRALSAGFRVCKTEKNYNNRLGVPLTLTHIPEDAEIAVWELGLNVPGELGTIASLTDIDTAVITNIGTAHMEYYGSMEGICREKFTVTRGFSSDNPRPKRLFLSADDPYLRRYPEFTDYPATTFGLSEDADYRAVNLRSEGGRYVFDLVRKGSLLFPVSLSALGHHNALNALASLAVADHYGVDLSKAAEEIARFTGFPGRLYRIEEGGALFVDDTYNASPASMKAGLSVLSEISFGTGGKIAVLGDMLELGPDSEKLHYEIGAFAAGLPLEKVVLVGREARAIGRGLKENGSRADVEYHETAEEALDALKGAVESGKTYYFKASHGMGFSKIVEGLSCRG